MRIGYACKTIADSKALTESLNEKSTTVTWLNRQKKSVAEQRMLDIAKHNAQYILRVLNYITEISKIYPEMKMFRIGSGILPAYTHPDWKYFWKQPDVIKFLESNFFRIGEFARKNDIRLSMHPNQYVCLASDRDEVVERSIEEFEYHTDVIKYMGYGKKFQDFKCNIHLGGRRGPEGFLKSYNKLSPEARNCITLENDEMSWGLDDILPLGNQIPIVLDIHHHLVNTGGEYITPSDPRIKQVINSWRGVRPVIHYSVSREEAVTPYVNVKQIDKINIVEALEKGARKQKIRAHSDMYWHHASNCWAKEFFDDFDIMCEAKNKNLAVINLIKDLKNKNDKRY